MQESIKCNVHGPEVWSPVGMDQPPLEGEQPIFELEKLAHRHEGSQGNYEHHANNDSNRDETKEIESSLPLSVFLRLWEAVGGQKEYKINGGDVEEDMFEIEKPGKGEGAPARLVIDHKSNRQDEDTKQHSVILKVYI